MFALLLTCALSQDFLKAFDAKPELKLDLSAFEVAPDRLAAAPGKLDLSAFDTPALNVNDPRFDKLIEPFNATQDEPSKKVCPCQGYKQSQCLCLQSKLQCHCSAHVGSVWQQLMSGLWEKTAEKADPTKPLPVPEKKPSAQPKQTAGAPQPAAQPKGHWESKGFTVCEFNRFGRKTGCHTEYRNVWVEDK